MVKIAKRIVEAADAREKDYLIWDDDLPGFGLRVFSSGKRSYVIQYRTRGRSRRYTIGLHGAWAPETARREARVQLGRVAGVMIPSKIANSITSGTPARFVLRPSPRRRRSRASHPET
jgi:hypothetical protein